MDTEVCFLNNDILVFISPRIVIDHCYDRPNLVNVFVDRFIALILDTINALDKQKANFLCIVH